MACTELIVRFDVIQCLFEVFLTVINVVVQFIPKPQDVRSGQNRIPLVQGLLYILHPVRQSVDCREDIVLFADFLIVPTNEKLDECEDASSCE